MLNIKKKQAVKVNNPKQFLQQQPSADEVAWKEILTRLQVIQICSNDHYTERKKKQAANANNVIPSTAIICRWRDMACSILRMNFSQSHSKFFKYKNYAIQMHSIKFFDEVGILKEGVKKWYVLEIKRMIKIQ